MKENVLITGVNGHLGNNLLRNLLAKGIAVKGTVRNINDTQPFKGLNFSPVYADLLDKESLLPALKGVDTLYQVAAVFKIWTPNPEKDIYEANMIATRNIMEAAAEMKVKKVVYVSSIAAIGRDKIPMNPDEFNTENENIYYRSKIDSEKLAHAIAQKHKLHFVSVCPSAMIGSFSSRLTPSHKILRMVLNKDIFTDTQFYINWVDVKDVAEGCFLAAQKGRNGERYGLGTPKAIGVTEVVAIAKDLYPDLNLRIPFKMPKWMLKMSAASFERIAKITKKEPMLLKSQVRMYYKVHQHMDISKSVKELGYVPKDARKAIRDALQFLYENPEIK